MEKSWIAPVLSNSLDDLSEFADAEETVSAPTELLAEFLHSIMLKDYEKALGYCNEILSYEPDYAIVKEFRPIIEEKLEMLRNEESEGGSSNSSSSLSSSTSDSLEDLHSIKDKTNWDAGSLNLSSLGSDDETNKTSRTRASVVSHSDAANGNTETHSPPSPAENSAEDKGAKTVNTSATRTILNAKLLAHKTRTRVLRRDGDNRDRNNESDRSKNENSSTLLRSTNTRVLKTDSAPEPEKDNNNSRTFGWFSSLQENFFGSKKRELSRSKNSDQNSQKATNDDNDDDDDDNDNNNNNGKGEKTGKGTKTIQNKHAIK